MSQKDQLAWERLASVIEWSGMTINHFAKHIGITRSERLYQIQRGNNGISRKLAGMVVEAFPQVSLIWLVNGRGEMFASPVEVDSCVTLYNVDVERFDGVVDQHETALKLILPSAVDAEFAMRYCGAAMSNTIAANSIVMLKEVTQEAVIPGGEYVVVCENFTVLRIVRRGECDGMNTTVWRLVASLSEHYDDIFVRSDQIRYIYKVAAKLIING